MLFSFPETQYTDVNNKMFHTKFMLRGITKDPGKQGRNATSFWKRLLEPPKALAF